MTTFSGQTRTLGGLDANRIVDDVVDRAGFYVLGDEVPEHGFTTEFCAIGKVSTETYQGDSDAMIIGRLVFFVVRADEENEESSDDEVEYSIVGDRVGVAVYLVGLQANETTLKNCTSAEIEVEEGDRVVIFIRSVCRTTNGRNLCPLQVNFMGDGDYNTRFYNQSDTVRGTISNDAVENSILQNSLISVADTFLNVQVLIESGM